MMTKCEYFLASPRFKEIREIRIALMECGKGGGGMLMIPEEKIKWALRRVVL